MASLMAMPLKKVRVRDNSKAVRITNMPLSSNEEDLKLLARKCSGIREMYLAKHHTTGKFKEFAYILFKTRKQAEDAVYTLNGLNYNNKVLSVVCATSAF